MPKLRLQDLLRPTTTPEQANFLDWFYTFFDNGSAAHKKILNVEPIFFMGELAGSEFLVYSVNKLYLALNFSISGLGTNSANNPTVRTQLFDENNNNTYNFANDMIYYDTVTTTPYVSGNETSKDNLYFSRIVIVVVHLCIFNGYRITLN